MLFRNIRFLSLISALVLSTFYGVEATIPHTQVGLIDSAKGQVWGSAPWRDKDAKAHKQKGDTVVQDEVIATGFNARTTITFIDKTILKMGENARITIDEMVYDPANNEMDKVVLRLGQGAFYFVSGKVAKQKVTLITPTATIGIRGTELLISVKPNGATTVAVTSGRAFMRSRNNRSSNEISTGKTGRSDENGNVSDAHDGVDLTGDDDVDLNVDGVSDWQDDKEKEKDIAEFSDEGDEEGDGKEGEGEEGDKDDGEDGDDDGEGEGEDGDKENDDEGDHDGEGDSDDEGDSDSEGDSDGGGDSDSEGDSGDDGSDGGHDSDNDSDRDGGHDKSDDD
ncbi:MAG: hypothetical protein COB59_00045 [Rhodospirillaceae bacterium]|nr:MAG: hypothetical protein COB59_00045 [Rhodospirillaceae bacterium]